MGKITRTASQRHEASISPGVSSSVQKFLHVPLHHLPSELDCFPKRWPFPRGDLYHWIDLLNRFDEILERLISLYHLNDGPQTQPFTRKLLLQGDGRGTNGSTSEENTQQLVPSEELLDSLGYGKDGDRELVEGVLRFSQLLLEHCSNRSLYASSGRLNDLLNTTSLSLLEQTLRLGHRLAQRYAMARHKSGTQQSHTINMNLLHSHYMIDIDKVEQIAQPFLNQTLGKYKTPGILGPQTGHTADIRAGMRKRPDLLSLVMSAHSLEWQKDGLTHVKLSDTLQSTHQSSSSSGSSAVDSSTSPSTPTPLRRQTPHSASVAISPSSSSVANDSKLQIDSASKPKMDFSSPSLTSLVLVSSQRLASEPLCNIVQEFCHGVLQEQRYELLHKLRIGAAWGSDAANDRQRIIAIRLLAIMNLAYILPEHMFQQKLLSDSEEPRRAQLPQQLCDLLHPPGHDASVVPKSLQSLALGTLESLLVFKSKLTDVATALNVNASHGVLSYSVRKAVTELTSGESYQTLVEKSSPLLSEVELEDGLNADDSTWIESLFSLIENFPKSSRASENLVSTGLLEMLVEVLNSRSLRAHNQHTRILHLLDGFTYSIRDAFNNLIESDGLDAMSNLLAFEVDAALSLLVHGKGMPNEWKVQNIDYEIPFLHQQTLRYTFKLLRTLMNISGGPFDRLLRNLIESSQLLNALKLVISKPQQFGSNVWSGALSVLTAFIHSEPTSYAAIAEAGLTKAFLETITGRPLKPLERHAEGDEASAQSPGALAAEKDEPSVKDFPVTGIPVSAESIFAIPMAFGAICLNEAGTQQLLQSDALRTFSKIFTSSKHVQVLAHSSSMDVDDLGSCVEELARHHPRIKNEIVTVVAELTECVHTYAATATSEQPTGPCLYVMNELGEIVVDGGKSAMRVGLNNLRTTKVSLDSEDVEMKDAPHLSVSEDGGEEISAIYLDQLRLGNRKESVTDTVGIFARFLMGFMKNTELCTPFAETKGIEYLLDMATHATLSSDSASQGSHGNKLARLIHVLAENKPQLVVPSIVRRFLQTTELLQWFSERDSSPAFVVPYLSDVGAVSQQHGHASGSGTSLVRLLAKLIDLSTLFTKCLQSTHQRSPSPAMHMLNLVDLYVPLIYKLGDLQKACIWEFGYLQQYDPAAWSRSLPQGESTAIPNHSTRTPVSDNVASVSNSAANVTSQERQTDNAMSDAKTESEVPKKQKEAQSKNSHVLRGILSQLPLVISTLFSTMGKMVWGKRLPNEPYLRNNVTLMTNSVARTLVKQLDPQQSSKHPPQVWEYYRMTVMSLASSTMVDKKVDADRALVPLIVLLIKPFKELGGFHRLGKLLEQSSNELLAMKIDEQSPEQNRTRPPPFNGVSSTLKFFLHLATAKNVLEASQTAALSALAARGSDRNRADFFSGNQLLVELRMAVLDCIMPIWESEKIQNMPPELIKILANTLQQIQDSSGESQGLRRENQKPHRTDITLQAYRLRSNEFLSRLSEMEYDETLVREALYRCNENFTPAREYCEYYTRNADLERFPIPPWDSPLSSEPSQVTEPDAEGSKNESESVDVFPAGMSSILNNHSISISELEEGKNYFGLHVEEVDDKEDMDVVCCEDVQEKRSQLTTGIMERCLAIISAATDVTFELAALISASTWKPDKQNARNSQSEPERDWKLQPQDVCETLTQSLISFQGADDVEGADKKIASCAHLLGIILQEKYFFEAASDDLKNSFPFLVDYLSVSADQSSQNPPTFSRQIMLILERILAEDTQPASITWEVPRSEDAQIPYPSTQMKVSFIDEKNKGELFDIIVDMMPRLGKDSQLALSIVRLLVNLTRNRQLAMRLGEKRNLQRLFVMVKQLAGNIDERLRAAFMIVLRHVVEDDETIKQLMRSEIRAMFEKPPPTSLDVAAYTRNLGYLVLRAPELFVTVTDEILEVPNFSAGKQTQALALKASNGSDENSDGTTAAQKSAAKSEVDTSDPPQTQDNPDAIEKGKSVELKAPVVENPDGLVHYLLSELLSYRDVEDKLSKLADVEPSRTVTTDGDVEMVIEDGASSMAPGNNTSPDSKIDEKPVFKADDHPIFLYRCFILQCLAELLQSYNRAKIEFINFSRKSDPQSSTPSKPRSGVLNYILNVLIPTGTIQHAEDVTFKKRYATSNCAMTVITSLCQRTTEKGSPKRRDLLNSEDEPELLFIRRFALEHALKAYKDANSSTDLNEAKYSKMISLADLFFQMLGPRPNMSPQARRQQDPADDGLIPSQRQIAKVMFEKNFIVALTNSISDIDLSMPGYGRVVKYILRPLRLLTYTAIDLSLSSDVSSTSTSGNENDEISSATSISEDEGVEQREETPDLFRNSTLGMFEPGREDESSSGSASGSEDEEEEVYGDVYADDMEFEVEDEHDEDGMESDEDEEMEGIGEMEGLPGDIGSDVEIDIDHSEESGMGESDTNSDDLDDEDSDDNDEGSIDHDDFIMNEIENNAEAHLDDIEGEWPNEDEEDEIPYDDDGNPIELELAPAPGGLIADVQSDDDNTEEFPRAVLDDGITHEEIDFEIDPMDPRDPMDHDGHLDDESAGEEDDDDEEDEDDEEDIIFTRGIDYDEDDSEMPPFTFSGMESTHGRRPTSLQPRYPLSSFMRPPDRTTILPGYTSHRPGPAPRSSDDGANPLLERRIGQESNRITSGRRSGVLPVELPFLPRMDFPGHPALGLSADGHQHPLAYFSEFMNALGNPGQSWSSIRDSVRNFTHHHGLGPSIHFSMSQRPGRLHDLEAVLEITESALPHHHHHAHRHHHHHHLLPPPPTLFHSDPSQSVAFAAATTMDRWQEEMRLIWGSASSEKCQMVNGAIMQLLVPKAMEVARERKSQALAQSKRDEEARAKEQAEKEAREKKEREERQAREAREAREAEERAAAAAATAAQNNETTTRASAADAMEGVENTNAESSSLNTGNTTNENTPRVYTNIRGQQIDITDLGIDLAYIEAIPEELREEVVLQRYTEQRSEATAAGEEATAINQEFLDALPAEIRDEILQQEAQSRRRRERQEESRRRAAEGNLAREDTDPASFIASLDPILRRSVLAGVDDATLSVLPPHIITEARDLGMHGRRRLDPTRFLGHMDASGSHESRRGGETNNTRTVERQRRPIVQMLDKAGIATLLRLMFISIHGPSRINLNGILRNASGNYQTRAEIVSGLLSILQEGSADASSIERAFSQLSIRARQGITVNKAPVPGPQTSGKKTQVASNVTGIETSPLAVIGHCLSALAFLTKELPHVPKFFLTEHEVGNASQKSKSSKKGKSKETRASRFPINALLMLLGRSMVVENSTVMDHLASLLQSVTQPLPSMLKRDKEEQLASTSSRITTDELTARPRNPQEIFQMFLQGGSQHVGGEASVNEADFNSSTERTDGVNGSTQASESKKTYDPPEIPDENLRLIINILTARDCNSNTFRDTLSTINNLSTIPSAKNVFGEELVARARDLGKKIQMNLGQLIKALQNAQNEMEAQSLTLANFSPAGSDQSKLSRILTALDYLFETKSSDKHDSSTEQEDLLTKLYEDPAFSALWHQLSACLTATQQAEKYFLNVATILLPLIESLMVACKSLASDSRVRSGKDSVPTTPAAEGAMRSIFFTFTNRHKKILNDLVRHNPKLMSGSFAVLIKNSPVLEFDNKRNYFTRKLHQRSSDARYHHPPLQLNVRRDSVFVDSYLALYFKKAEEIKYGKLNIRFINEEGVDAGGVTREWFQVLARQMFDPSYALFIPVASDRTTFHPNPISAVNEDHLKFFNFIGRILGKALYENRVLDCHFSRAVYKQIIGKSVSLKDMETIDLDYTKSLQWMLDNDITDVLTETFSITKENFGATKVIDLVENGRNVPVTDENKHEYVRLIIEHTLTGSVQEQLNSFLVGFHDIVPPELISIFDEGELELLISGMPEIDVDDWKNHTEYTSYNATSPQIQWFWRAVRSFDKEERAKLLQFVTGTGKVPLNGFRELEGMNGVTKFSIHKDFGSKDRLPSSHTCFNQLDLPEYDSYEQLRRSLYTAMTTGNEYFGFA